MKRTSLFHLALLLALVTTGVVRAQRPTVTGHVEPDSVFIGDRFDLVLEVEKDMVQVVEFPVFENDESSDALELVESCPVDTLQRDGRRLHLRKRYRMAAFSEGVFNLGCPGVLYVDKNIIDTLTVVDSLMLKVGTFQLDSTSRLIETLKPQRKMPVRFLEFAGYLKWTLVILALLVVALYALIYWLQSRGQRFVDLFKPAPPQPPHVIAIRALEALHNQKLWQNNRHKQYYSALTDILRTYIAGRWEVSAMEMTSDEIVEAMRDIELPDKARMDLVSLLRDADLVKFAKAEPEAEQNEGDYLKCYYFVEETKPVSELPAEGPASPEAKNEA